MRSLGAVCGLNRSRKVEDAVVSVGDCSGEGSGQSRDTPTSLKNHNFLRPTPCRRPPCNKKSQKNKCLRIPSITTSLSYFLSIMEEERRQTPKLETPAPATLLGSHSLSAHVVLVRGSRCGPKCGQVVRMLHGIRVGKLSHMCSQTVKNIVTKCIRDRCTRARSFTLIFQSCRARIAVEWIPTCPTQH